MDVLRSTMLANMAALERQFSAEQAAVQATEQSVVKAATPPGIGQVVDKLA